MTNMTDTMMDTDMKYNNKGGGGGGLLIHVMYVKCLADLYYDLQEHRCWSTNKDHTLERKRTKSKSEQDIFHDVSQPDRREFVQDVI